MRRGFLLIIALALVLAACGAPTAPAPAPVPASTTAAAPAGPQAPSKGVALGPRPRDIRIDGIHPCSVLTPLQLRTLGYSGDPTSGQEDSPLYGPARTCTIFAYDPQIVSVNVSLVDTKGVEVWTGGSLAASVVPITVGGFPALLVKINGVTDSCSIELDVAPARMIDVQVHDGGGTPPISQDDLCARVQKAAEQVMVTLTPR